MKLVILLTLLIFSGCATKYILPGTRFITPETQGGLFNTNLEYQGHMAHELTGDLSNRSVKNGVDYEVVSKGGLSLATSVHERVDLTWGHVGDGNSLIGLKFQVLGGPRAANAAGHKLVLGGAMGGNEHETDGNIAVEFELSGQELFVGYGYRLNPSLLPYTTLTKSSYSFSGRTNSIYRTLDGLEPKYESDVLGLYAGLEFSFGIFVTKLESGYQQIKTTDTKDKTAFVYGWTLGFAW